MDNGFDFTDHDHKMFGFMYIRYHLNNLKSMSGSHFSCLQMVKRGGIMHSGEGCVSHHTVQQRENEKMSNEKGTPLRKKETSSGHMT